MTGPKRDDSEDTHPHIAIYDDEEATQEVDSSTIFGDDDVAPSDATPTADRPDQK